MTYCILGFCETTGQSGIAYTTVTIAGGGTSPFYTYGGDIVVVQAYGNIATGIAGARAGPGAIAGRSDADDEGGRLGV